MLLSINSILMFIFPVNLDFNMYVILFCYIRYNNWDNHNTTAAFPGFHTKRIGLWIRKDSTILRSIVIDANGDLSIPSSAGCLCGRREHLPVWSRRSCWILWSSEKRGPDMMGVREFFRLPHHLPIFMFL